MQPPVFNKFEGENKDFQSIGKMLWLYLGIILVIPFIFPGDINDGLAGVLSSLALVLVIWYGRKKTKVELPKDLYKLNFSFKDFGSAFILMTGLSTMALFMILIFSSIFMMLTGLRFPQATIDFDLSSVSSWIFLAYACVFGPILEEIMFRGVILRTLKRYNVFFAIVASSMIFGLYHMYLEQGLHAFIVGLVMAYFSIKYDSLSLPIILHIAHNTLSFLPSLFTPTAILMMIFRIVCLILVLIKFEKGFRVVQQEYKEDPIAYPFYSRLFFRFSFISWFIFFVLETILSFV